LTERIPLDPLTFGPDQRCFGCGPANPMGMGLRFFREGDEVVTTFTARDGWEGPPGILHGGLQATLADEIGAWTVVGLRGRFGFTGSAELRWIRPARVDRPIEARGRITDEAPGRVTVRVRLLQDGRPVLTGRLRYTLPTIAQAERILGAPLPADWHHLARPEGEAG
jgi:acyl-coenzyme A thioesterase PaaI-like protein